jgi:hypothetical protein
MIKTKIKLDSEIFKAVSRRQAISNLVGRSARDFKNLTKRRIIESRPAGRLYSRGPGTGFTRAHRASAKGQRPAIDTGKLLNSIDDKRTGELSSEAFAGAEYAKHLQSARLDRPIMSDGDVNEAQAKLTRDAEHLITSLK